MKIGIVFYDMQDFGGLEEYAVALAIGLKQQDYPVNVFSCAWIKPGNQYLARLRDQDIPVIQPPKWLSLPASDWGTKEKLVALLLKFSIPLVVVLSLGLALVKRRPIKEAFRSAGNWIQGLLGSLIYPDRRQAFTKIMLSLWAKTWHPDVLHLQGYTTNLLYVIEWGHKRQIPVVYEEHQTPDPMFDWWHNFKATINKATVVVAVSENSAQGLREICEVTRPIEVRNPLMVDPIMGQDNLSLTLKPEGSITITTLARLYETKGLNYLLEAAVQIKKSFPDTAFKVFGDGPLQDPLLEYAAKLGLDGTQIFVGAFNHKDLPEIMAQTDIFLLSSILEGQPLALVEAMAYSRPIVATSVGGIPELIQDGENGFLCPPADPDCLANNVIKFIENPELRQRMGQAARQSYESGPYQPEAVSQELAGIYAHAIWLNEKSTQ